MLYAVAYVCMRFDLFQVMNQLKQFQWCFKQGFEFKLIHNLNFFRQLSGLVVERRPAALEAGVQTQGEEPKNF